MIIGRNPVAEALKSGREMERIIIQKGAGGSVGRILSLAKERGVIIRYEEKELLDKKAGGGRHQGVIAFVSAHRYASVEDMLALAERRGEPPFLIVLTRWRIPTIWELSCGRRNARGLME